MKMNTRSLGLAAAAIFSLGLGGLGVLGCSNSSTPAATSNGAAAKANAGNFTSTVFLGDSLTAGYQSGSLVDTSQVHGWAPLVAQQAGFTIVLPLIAPPGAPSQLQLLKIGPPPVIVPAAGTTSGRDNFAAQPTDLAVPGAALNDVINTRPLLTPTTGQEQLNQLVLGYPGFGYGQAFSQAERAIALNPTTIFLWIGNNDALIADFTGLPSSMTPIADFTTQYTALIKLLTTKTTANLVIANIPDVTAIPYLQPAGSLLAQYSAVTKIPVATLSALLGISAGDFVNQSGLAQISAILSGTQKTPISDGGVLSAAEVVTARANVTAFNQVIATQAAAAGATLVDINALFTSVATNGLMVNGLTVRNGFLGGVFSLDGVHPTNTGYAVVANKFIDSLNAAIGTKIPDVDINAVAKADPLFPTNLGGRLTGGTEPMMQAGTTRLMDQYFFGAK